MSIPSNLAPISPYLRLYKELSLMYAVEKAIKIDSKSKESVSFLTPKIDELENKKAQLSKGEENEVMNSNDVTMAYMENYINRLFDYADTKDRESKWDMYANFY
ncbi:hypothetical protein HZS_7926 [Henneguya salminicola]|nr:hypothetical protein HZS_7926 [Henneguya salminicola]